MGRKNRLLAPEGVRGIYYVTSWVIERRKALKDPVDKEQFIQWMYDYAEFCGVKVLTYAIMNNHFHLLLDVLPCDPQSLSDEELLRRLSFIAPETKLMQYKNWFASFPRSRSGKGRPTKGDKLRAELTKRMGNLSPYMQTLKQRFIQYFNSRHKRRGTLWEQRYESVLISGSAPEMISQAAHSIAAYIDLNPVRAKLVKDPAEYAYSGYGAAINAKKSMQTLAREGIRSIQIPDSTDSQEVLPNWREAHARYCQFLYQQQDQKKEAAGKTQKSSTKIDKTKPNRYFSKRLDWINQSLIIANQSFLETYQEHYQNYFSNKRKAKKVEKLPQQAGELWYL